MHAQLQCMHAYRCFCFFLEYAVLSEYHLFTMSGLSHENHVVYILLNHSNETATQQVFYISFHFYHTDINECADGTHNCDQQCHNTLGSYECSCNRNFILNYDGQACLGYQLVACNCSCILLLSDKKLKINYYGYQ